MPGPGEDRASGRSRRRSDARACVPTPCACWHCLALAAAAAKAQWSSLQQRGPESESPRIQGRLYFLSSGLPPTPASAAAPACHVLLPCAGVSVWVKSVTAARRRSRRRAALATCCRVLCRSSIGGVSRPAAASRQPSGEAGTAAKVSMSGTAIPGRIPRAPGLGPPGSPGRPSARSQLSAGRPPVIWWPRRPLHLVERGL